MTQTATRPLVGVGLLLTNDSNDVLMMRRRGSHGSGTWGFVGGHLNFGESPQDAAARETLEELGVILDPTKIRLGPYTNDVFGRRWRHYVTLFASARLPEGQHPRILEPNKCDAIGFFAFGDLPTPLFGPVATLLKQTKHRQF